MAKLFSIGKQSWTTENLNIDVFQNGEIINHAKNPMEWIEAAKNEQPAWCYFNNEYNNGLLLGRLYNWFAVNDKRQLAPKGFRIPNDDDWNELINSYGDKYEAGYQMRCKNNWIEKWFGIEREDFNALPGGYRVGSILEGKDGELLPHTSFYDKGVSCFMWSTSSYNESKANCFILNSDAAEIYNYPYSKGNGFSVRCLKT